MLFCPVAPFLVQVELSCFVSQIWIIILCFTYIWLPCCVSQIYLVILLCSTSMFRYLVYCTSETRVIILCCVLKTSLLCIRKTCLIILLMCFRNMFIIQFLRFHNTFSMLLCFRNTFNYLLAVSKKHV
jgi:hypothetical protein